jgi:hypothetical protein
MDIVTSIARRQLALLPISLYDEDGVAFVAETPSPEK